MSAVLKEHLLKDDSDDTPVRIRSRDKQGNVEEKRLPLGELKQAVKMTPGLRIAYVTDAINSRENIARILALADRADLLFIETTFLHEDAETAAKKYHLTALQAGTLARQARVKRIIAFHFSPKYKMTPHVLTEEALAAFRGTDGVATLGSNSYSVTGP